MNSTLPTRECGLAAETKVETPEGALAVRTLVGKSIAVFSRDRTARVRFRMMQNVRKVGEQEPVLKVTLHTGQSFRVAPEQVLFKKGLVECRADALQVGDALEPAFTYPDGYRYMSDRDRDQQTSDASLHVTQIEAAGTADIYSLGVNQTGCFFLTAGVLCKAES